MPSPSSRTQLLDLPNDVLSRIIHFTIPKPPACPTPTSRARLPRSCTNIGFTCTRLQNLVNRWLAVLDFVYPANALTHVTRFPRMSHAAVERLTRLTAPFLRVLRLPSDFQPTLPDLSAFPPCRNLKELSLPLAYSVTRAGIVNFLKRLKKLEVFTVYSPIVAVFQVLAMSPCPLRELTVISLHASGGMFKVLDKLLRRLHSLERLTVTFSCIGRERVLNPYNMDNQKMKLSFPETLQAFSELIRWNAHNLTALREVSVSTNDRSPQKRMLIGDGENVDRMVKEINAVRAAVAAARAYARDHPPVVKLARLQVQMFVHGAEDLKKSIKGLIQVSTEVDVVFETLTVSYPPAEQSVSPSPVVKDISFFFEDDHWPLKQHVDFKPQSVSILRKESARMLARETTRPFLAHALHGCIESIKVEYLPETAEEFAEMLGLLSFMTCFAPSAHTLTLPASVVARSEFIPLEGLLDIKCAASVRVLWLDFITSETFQRDPTGIVIFGDDSLNFFCANAEQFVAGFEDFLGKVRIAFPKLTHLFLERTQLILKVEGDVIDRTESIIEEYEAATGVDASSVKLELRHWVKKESHHNDVDFVQVAMDLEELGIADGLAGE